MKRDLFNFNGDFGSGFKGDIRSDRQHWISDIPIFDSFPKGVVRIHKNPHLCAVVAFNWRINIDQLLSCPLTAIVHAIKNT